MNDLINVSWIMSYTDGGRPRYSKGHIVRNDRGAHSRWDGSKALCGAVIPSHAGAEDIDSGSCKACKRIARTLNTQS